MSLIILVAFGLLLLHPGSRIPKGIKQQVSFTILYPIDRAISLDNWKYLSSQHGLSFIAHDDNFSVTFTEQAVPLAFQNDMAAYNRFIGGLRPSANFKTSLGTVSLVTFVTAHDFQVAGQAGILNADGTLLLAHPDRTLSDDEWRSVFDALGND
ncbi:MAG TPA: hypothetical protein VNG90_04620 [Candidatus Acidoferrum sp.]|nr:hypothetical protein [Candidatus Acidoferrum sp.]